MRLNTVFTHILCCFAATLVSAAEVPAAKDLVPSSFDICSGYETEETPRVYTRETMYEHVNGEAELLKRYGAKELVYASFASDRGDSFTVELIDLGSVENAFGLYRLYTGCDEDIEEVRKAEFTISMSRTTSFAFKGNIFLRINTLSEDDRCKNLAAHVAKEIFAPIEVLETYPSIVSAIGKNAGKDCDVSYYPDVMSFEMDFGAGYRWKGKDGTEYYLRVSKNRAEAENFVERISRTATILVVSSGKIVVWTVANGEKRKDYLNQVMKDVSSSKKWDQGKRDED